MMQRSGIIRAGLVALGLPQLLIGIWATFDTQGWFNSFPGPGASDWLPVYGGYNEHLALDVGATFMGIGAALILAAVWMERRAVQVALVAYLLYALPHFIYHLGADDALPSGEQIASGAALALATVVAAALLVMTRTTTVKARRPSSASANGAARIVPKTTGVFARFGNWYAKRSYGGEVTPGAVFANHPKLAMGYGALELATERSHLVDEKLKGLAEIKTAAVVNCEWCIDFGSFIANKLGIPDEQLAEMPRHRESAAYNELEKLVIDYAVAMTRTPAEVDDDLFARLREHFDDAQLVELTSAIAIENFRARFNGATGMASQGFSEGMVCVVPEPEQVASETVGSPG